MLSHILLLSSSVVHGSGYLDWCADELRAFLGDVKTVLFVPYARPNGASLDEYTRVVRERFRQWNIAVDGIHESSDPAGAVASAEAIYIGGGNTFVLLNDLYVTGVMPVIRERVKGGLRYVGSSAGSNVAGTTIGTTNDMPVVQPPSFEALRLVPFNLNPHYLDTEPDSMHKGETREARIHEFHRFNPQPVVGLREGSMLQIDGDAMNLRGGKPCRLFRPGREPEEHNPGEDLSFLLS